jgi:NitT/TauT family transport system substrate-binding protein
VLVVTLQQAGYRLNLIFPDDYGVHFYADALFTTDALIATNPDLVTRFLRSTLKGWAYAVERPADIGPMIVKHKPDADPALESAKMTASLPLVNTGEDHIGWMTPEIWAGMETILRQQGVLEAPLDVTAVYTTRFLEAIYRSGAAR